MPEVSGSNIGSIFLEPLRLGRSSPPLCWENLRSEGCNLVSQKSEVLTFVGESPGLKSSWEACWVVA